MTSRGRLLFDTVSDVESGRVVVDQPVLIEVERVEVERPATAAAGKVFRRPVHVEALAEP
jgi:hypothetical protein